MISSKVFIFFFILHVHDHFLVHVRVPDDLAKLLKVDAAVLVLVGEEDRLVDDLLQLRVLQVGAHHHLQDLEQLAVADVAVVVDVVDSEREEQGKQLNIDGFIPQLAIQTLNLY